MFHVIDVQEDPRVEEPASTWPGLKHYTAAQQGARGYTHRNGTPGAQRFPRESAPRCRRAPAAIGQPHQATPKHGAAVAEVWTETIRRYDALQ